MVAALKQIPTEVIAEATGYNPRTVRRLKHGEFQPSLERLTALIRLVMAGSVPSLSISASLLNIC